MRGISPYVDVVFMVFIFTIVLSQSCSEARSRDDKLPDLQSHGGIVTWSEFCQGVQCTESTDGQVSRCDRCESLVRWFRVMNNQFSCYNAIYSVDP